jgi:hypothetical protein
VLTPPRIHALIERAKAPTSRGRRLLVGTSFTRRLLPTDAVCRASDLILLHGNGIDDPADIAARVDRVRALSAYRPMPIVWNEDDHFDFDRPESNAAAALSRHSSWGYFDPGDAAGGGSTFGDYRSGYQSLPIDWGMHTPRKRAFFGWLREVAGSR